MLLKVPSKDTATVVAALGKHVRKLPQELRRSLTWDRGKEMADHTLRLNQRPRKTLGFETPADRLRAVLQ